jgi:hypothetical protein
MSRPGRNVVIEGAHKVALKSRTGSWRDMTNATAFSIGSVDGYFAYMSAMAAQDVWTTWVSSCSIHRQASHVCPINELRSNNFGQWAHLVALTPATIYPLLAHEKVACPASRLACFIRLTNEGKALQGEHRRISKANAPRAHPTSFRELENMQKRYGALYCFSIMHVQLSSHVRHEL